MRRDGPSRERRAVFRSVTEEKETEGTGGSSRLGSLHRRPAMTDSAWTDDRVDRLKALWLEGRTADWIARDLAHGITRSAVLGKVHRLGLSAGRTPAVTATLKAKPPKPRGEAGRATPLSGATEIVARSSTPPIAPVKPQERGLSSVLTIRHRQCRWPLGDPRAIDFSLCGRPVARGAFCGPHAAVAYRAKPDTVEALERLARLN